MPIVEVVDSFESFTVNRVNPESPSYPHDSISIDDGMKKQVIIDTFQPNDKFAISLQDSKAGGMLAMVHSSLR
jgi:hypothetical protein